MTVKFPSPDGDVFEITAESLVVGGVFKKLAKLVSFLNGDSRFVKTFSPLFKRGKVNDKLLTAVQKAVATHWVVTVENPGVV